MEPADPTNAPELTEKDVQHLRWLAYGDYVLAALSFLCGAVFFILIPMGIAQLFGAIELPAAEEPPEVLGAKFIGAGFWITLIAWGLGAALIASARFLRARRRRLFCIVVGVIAATGYGPCGPVIGLCTVLVLMRPSVLAAFDRKTSAGPSVAPLSF